MPCLKIPDASLKCSCIYVISKYGTKRKPWLW